MIICGGFKLSPSYEEDIKIVASVLEDVVQTEGQPLEDEVDSIFDERYPELSIGEHG